MKLYKIKVNGKLYEVEVEEVDGATSKQEVVKQEVKQEVKEEKLTSDQKTINAPIAGKIVDVKVEVGSTIKKGDTVAIIEAMKLENEIQSPVSGTIKEVVVKAGDDVRNKDVLFVLE